MYKVKLSNEDTLKWLEQRLAIEKSSIRNIKLNLSKAYRQVSITAQMIELTKRNLLLLKSKSDNTSTEGIYTSEKVSNGQQSPVISRTTKPKKLKLSLKINPVNQEKVSDGQLSPVISRTTKPKICLKPKAS